MNKRRTIYPNCLRNYVNYTEYIEIAMQNYCKAKDAYERIKMLEYDDINQANRLRSESEKSSVITIVFAAMCMEAFFNDYAAAVLGDDEFYGSFDNLSIENKFQLITRFIFQVEFDKSKSYYSLLKKLVKLRNELVHCKSKNVTGHEFSEKITELEFDMKDFKSSREDCLLKTNKFLNDAFDALKAIKEIAYFFDLYDDNAYAIIKLFSPNYEKNIFFDQTYKNDILKELKIKDIELIKYQCTYEE